MSGPGVDSRAGRTARAGVVGAAAVLVRCLALGAVVAAVVLPEAPAPVPDEAPGVSSAEHAAAVRAAPAAAPRKARRP